MHAYKLTRTHTSLYALLQAYTHAYKHTRMPVFSELPPCRSCKCVLSTVIRMETCTRTNLRARIQIYTHACFLSLQVVQVCAEHKKPTKLAKHLQAIKEKSATMRNPPRVLVFANRVKVRALCPSCWAYQQKVIPPTTPVDLDMPLKDI